MIPTRRLLIVLVCGLLLAPVASLSPSGYWLLIGFDLIVLATALATVFLAPSARGLTLRRKFDPVLSVRVANKIDLVLEYEGDEPIFGRLRDEPPPTFAASRREFPLNIAPGSTHEFSYQLTPDERGSDYFRGTYLRIHCPLGLVEKDILLPTYQPVRVYPNVLAMREFDLLMQKGRLQQIGIRKTRMRGLGTEFESLRDYTIGDDYRKLDWKASARRGKPVVRQFEQERNQVVMICIDTGRKMLSESDGVRKLDHALDACLMLAHAATVAGDQVGLLVFSDSVKRYIPPRRGRNQIGAIIEAIHDLVAEPVESDYSSAFGYLARRWKRRSLMVIFAEVDDPLQAKELAGSLQSMAHRHLTLVARVMDVALKKAAIDSISDTPSMYRKAAALFLSEDRQLAGTTLTAAGLHSLEAEPQDLVSALVTFYFQAKERSLI